MMLPLLKFWKPLAGVGLALILYFAWQHHEDAVEKRGYDKGHAAAFKPAFAKGYIAGHAAAIDQRRQQDLAKLAEDTAKQAALDEKLRAKQQTDAVQRQNERNRYETTIADLRADAGRGNSGMRAPGDSTGLPRSGEAEDRSAAGRPSGQEGYDLLPGTAQSVLDAAADLRQGVLDRNALIDAYNDVRARCTAPP